MLAALATAITFVLPAAHPAQATDTVELTLLATNDVHRQLAPIDDPGAWDDGLGGVAWLAAHLDAVRARAPEALHVDAGDLTGAGSTGLGFPGGYADEATVDAMEQVGLDVTTVGNHEFDAGLAEARRVREGGLLGRRLRLPATTGRGTGPTSPRSVATSSTPARASGSSRAGPSSRCRASASASSA